MNEGTSPFHSTLACHMCRRRKVKCSRELPHCMVCQRSAQECQYPESARRPGPKIGYVLASRKSTHDLAKTNEPKRQKISPSNVASDHVQADAENPASARPETTSSTPGRQSMRSLSLIIHPWHESYAPNQPASPLSASPCLSRDERNIISTSCSILGVRYECFDMLINQFFNYYTAFQLFQEPLLRHKLQNLESVAQVNALVCAMLAFAFKAEDSYGSALLDGEMPVQENLDDHFAKLAIHYLEQAINECDSEAVPLPLLQALTLTTHWLLAQGACGRAWRYLGLCVRCAYELNLHLIDSGRTWEDILANPAQWQDDEERRRVWWAIWEMDVFASVMRRYPTAIDMSHNETWLPAEDGKWYRGEPQRSCLLAKRTVDRCHLLEASGNQSPKAWFIVINSMVKDAQNISSPFGVRRDRHRKFQGPTRGNDCQTDTRCGDEAFAVKAASDRLSAIDRSLQCCVIALPTQLKYHDEFLSFGGRMKDRASALAQRLHHGAIYSIHLMVQLVRLVTYKYYIFHGGRRSPLPFSDAHGAKQIPVQGEATPKQQLDRTLGMMRESPYLEQYFEAADQIMTIVHRSSENHHRFVNPFLSSTVWLAAVVQLIHCELAQTEVEKDLAHSSYEILNRKYNQSAQHWNTLTSLRKDIDALRNELGSFQGDEQDQESGGSNRQSPAQIYGLRSSNIGANQGRPILISAQHETGPERQTLKCRMCGTGTNAANYSPSGPASNVSTMPELLREPESTMQQMGPLPPSSAAATAMSSTQDYSAGISYERNLAGPSSQVGLSMQLQSAEEQPQSLSADFPTRFAYNPDLDIYGSMFTPDFLGDFLSGPYVA